VTHDAETYDRGKSKRLTVLITNIAFAFRSGTEIVVDQIARGLSRRGHRPIVFAPYVAGALAEELRRNGIAVVDRLNQIGFKPDIIHGQHNVATVMALAAFPSCPALFSCHDFVAMKDRAPLLPRIRRYLAVDEVCRERLIGDGVPEDKIDIVYNAVELEQFARRSPLPPRPERALVLTKGVEHLPIVRAAVQKAGLALDELGSGPGMVVDDLPARLPNYDLVIATARMAKEAMAVGCAVVVCDHRGFAGLATTKVLAEWRRHNFGRRILNSRVTENNLLQAIANYDSDDAAKVTDFIRAKDNLDSHIDQLERVYAAILDDTNAASPAEDMMALGKFLEDFLISRDFSRPWAALYQNVVDESTDVMERALHRHTTKLQAAIMGRFNDLTVRMEGRLEKMTEHPTQPIDLAEYVIHNEAAVNFDEYLSFTTPRQQWSYALSIACPQIVLPSYIEIETHVESGAVGFGLTGPELKEHLVEEIFVRAKNSRQLIRIPVPEPKLVRMRLVVRNASEKSETSRGTIYCATVLVANTW
jgi:Glycosyltransferase Family 4